MVKQKVSAFERWFKAKFGPIEHATGMQSKTTDQLYAMTVLGRAAEHEMFIRNSRRLQHSAAQTAWTARDAAPGKKEKYEHIGRLFKHRKSRKSKKKGPKDA